MSQQRLIDVGEVPTSTGKATSVRKSRRQKAYNRMLALLLYAVLTGNPLRIIGPHGIGKTSWVMKMLHRLGVEVIYFSLATTAPEDFIGVVPEMSEDGEASSLRVHLLSRLMSDQPKVLVFDELERAAPQVFAQVMELVNSGMLGGQKIPNLVGVVALGNPEGGPYMVSGLDPAQARRFVTVEITAADLPWIEALEDEFSSHFSESVFENLEDWYFRQDATVVRDVPPRVLEHMLSLAAAGLPIDLALPTQGRNCLQIYDAAEKNVTEEVLFDLARILGASVSSDASEMGAKFENKVVETIRFAIENGKNAYMVGDYGIAKTSTIRSLTEPGNPIYPEGIDVVIFDATQMSPENLGVPVPVRVVRDGKSIAVLDFLIYDQFMSDRPYVMVVDELKRASTRTKNALMEVIQERTLHGVPLKGLVCVIALDNPSGSAFSAVPTADGGTASAEAFVYSVGELDPAQQTRFAAHLRVTASDFEWADYQRSCYGDAAGPFIDFWNENLTDAERVMFSPANVEDAVQMNLVRQNLDDLPALFDALGTPAHVRELDFTPLTEQFAGLDVSPLTLKDLELTIPFINGKRLPVSMHELRMRLQDREVVSFRNIAADPEAWYAKLEGSDEHVRLEANFTVQQVLMRSETQTIEAHKELVQELVKRLSYQMQVALTGGNPLFWFPYVKTAKAWQMKNGWDPKTGTPPAAPERSGT